MKSILVIGLGRFGRHIGKNFLDEGNSVLAIEKDSARADSLADSLPNIQIADTTDEHFIKTLGVSNFDICVVAIGDDFQSALETTVLLKDYGAPFILARANSEIHRKLLLRNGADEVIYSEKEIAKRLAIKHSPNNIFDYIELNENVAIYEIATPKQWVGKSIIENAVRTKYNVSILAIKKYGEFIPIPSPNYIFDNDETIIVMGSFENIKKITK